MEWIQGERGWNGYKERGGGMDTRREGVEWINLKRVWNGYMKGGDRMDT